MKTMMRATHSLISSMPVSLNFAMAEMCMMVVAWVCSLRHGERLYIIRINLCTSDKLELSDHSLQDNASMRIRCFCVLVIQEETSRLEACNVHRYTSI